MPYIHFTEEQKRQANLVNLAEFLRGMDKDYQPHHAHKRSTNSQGKSFRITVEGSDFRYAFNIQRGGGAYGTTIRLLKSRDRTT